MTKVAVVYRSDYGYARRQAEAVAQGAGADLIAMGSPTCMGSVSSQFKKFADASSKPWLGQKWKNKVGCRLHQSRHHERRQVFYPVLPIYPRDAARHDAGEHRGVASATM